MACSRFSVYAVLALLAVPTALSAGCGSSDTSEFPNANDDSNGDGGNNNGGGFGTVDDGGTSRPCEGLECQRVVCSGGGTTSLSGKVFAPNGRLPIYNAIVYVPNAPVDPFPTTGVTCDKCGTTPSGRPVATALSDFDGSFKLENVPVGDNIPLVIQIGKWRRQVTIPTVKSCVDTPLVATQTRLPKNKSEGDIPKIALTTGGADSLECFFRKLGVDQSEFTTRTGAGRIHLFNGIRRAWECQRWHQNGYWEGRDGDECEFNNFERIREADWTSATPPVGTYRVNNKFDGIETIAPNAGVPRATELWGSTAGGTTGTTCSELDSDLAPKEGSKRCVSAKTTWPAAPNRLKEYDMVVLSCEGAENNGTKDAAARAALREYMNSGGRVFNSHFHYTWYRNQAPGQSGTNPLRATASWTSQNETVGDRDVRIDTSFAKGEAFGKWLVAANAATVAGANTNTRMTELRKNVTTVPAASRRWIYEPGDSNSVKFYSFNMPLGSAADAQCGRAVYTDIHVSSGDESGGTFPNNCRTLNQDMTAQEKALLFLMMDLSSCIQDENLPPVPPPPVK